LWKILRLTGLWVSGGQTRERARVDEGPLQPFDGRREAFAPSARASSAAQLAEQEREREHGP